VCPTLERHNTCNEGSNLTASCLPEEMNDESRAFSSFAFRTIECPST